MLVRLLLAVALSMPPLACIAAESASASRASIVGTGDSREGYDSTGYRTDSRSVETLEARSADLAGLARHPPLGLPPLAGPPERDAIDLGRRLFFDRRLSANGTLSCGMCHVPEQAFTQHELATPVGIGGKSVRRNAPSLYNVGYRPRLFHDARESALEAQIWSPLLADNEMGNRTKQEVLERVRGIAEYRDAFARMFEAGLDEHSLGAALAAYQRALLSADSPFDRWFYGGESDAIGASAKRGFKRFNELGCARCHLLNNAFAHFTDDDLHRTGIGHARAMRSAAPLARVQIAPGVFVDLAAQIPRPVFVDDGFAEVSGDEADRWRYRTPSLRNVGATAPYMHDGSLATLAEVIDFYARGAVDDVGRDPLIQPLGIDAADRVDLEAFLQSLTGSNLDALAADARTAPIGDTLD